MVELPELMEASRQSVLVTLLDASEDPGRLGRYRDKGITRAVRIAGAYRSSSTGLIPTRLIESQFSSIIRQNIVKAALSVGGQPSPAPEAARKRLRPTPSRVAPPTQIGCNLPLASHATCGYMMLHPGTARWLLSPAQYLLPDSSLVLGNGDAGLFRTYSRPGRRGPQCNPCRAGKHRISADADRARSQRRERNNHCRSTAAVRGACDSARLGFRRSACDERALGIV